MPFRMRLFRSDAALVIGIWSRSAMSRPLGDRAKTGESPHVVLFSSRQPVKPDTEETLIQITNRLLGGGSSRVVLPLARRTA